MSESKPSLESLIESADLGLEILHPGGLEMTRELAELTKIRRDTTVLDVASGTGRSACYLTETIKAKVVGIEISSYMVEKARKNAEERKLNIEFRQGDAHNLPFPDNTFDTVISECTTCLLQKKKAIGEMVRVTKPGGHIGIHDLCWKENTPKHFKDKLERIEGENPETLNGWKALFEEAGLVNVLTVDKSVVSQHWSEEIRKNLGATGELKIFFKVISKWGFRGLSPILQSERIILKHTGYGITVGTKPLSPMKRATVIRSQALNSRSENLEFTENQIRHVNSFYHAARALGPCFSYES